jgi:hypothetical protein
MIVGILHVLYSLQLAREEEVTCQLGEQQAIALRVSLILTRQPATEGSLSGDVAYAALEPLVVKTRARLSKNPRP